jgi:hypothetical protein
MLIAVLKPIIGFWFARRGIVGLSFCTQIRVQELVIFIAPVTSSTQLWLSLRSATARSRVVTREDIGPRFRQARRIPGQRRNPAPGMRQSRRANASLFQSSRNIVYTPSLANAAGGA